MGTIQLQLWECGTCHHTFYTKTKKKQAWYRRLFHRAVKLKCPVCGKLDAVQIKIIMKELRGI